MRRLGDPFVDTDPAVVVHEIDPHEFEDLWHSDETVASTVTCPVCSRGKLVARDTSPAKQREWIAFSCGDVVAAEITAG